MAPVTDQRPSAEDFRSSLKELIAVGRKLMSLCVTSEELIEVAELAVLNDGQLRILMELVLGSGTSKNLK